MPWARYVVLSPGYFAARSFGPVSVAPGGLAQISELREAYRAQGIDDPFHFVRLLGNPVSIICAHCTTQLHGCGRGTSTWPAECGGIQATSVPNISWPAVASGTGSRPIAWLFAWLASRRRLPTINSRGYDHERQWRL